MQRFWLCNLSITVAMIAAFLTVNYALRNYGIAEYAAAAACGIAVVQLLWNVVFAVKRFRQHTSVSAAIGLFSISFSALTILYLFNYTFLASC